MQDIPIEFAKFKAREDRSKFVYSRFKPYFAGKVLDVGCYKAPLRPLIGRDRYVGIDIDGEPDVRQDLNASTHLPFGDCEFDTVISIETLEHIDDLHAIFGECARVAREYLIVSLPNCWRDARRPIEKGRGEFAHYGLPSEKPLDRHRWFFNFSEAISFYQDMTNRFPLVVTEIFGTEQPRNGLVRALRKIRYSGRAYQNRYVQTAWVVFKRTDT